jgi:hypothetical protein
MLKAKKYIIDSKAPFLSELNFYWVYSHSLLVTGVLLCFLSIFKEKEILSTVFVDKLDNISNFWIF